MKGAESKAVSYKVDGQTAQHFPDTAPVDEEGIPKNAPEGLSLAGEEEEERHFCATSEVPSQWLVSNTHQVLGSTSALHAPGMVAHADKPPIYIASLRSVRVT